MFKMSLAALLALFLGTCSTTDVLSTADKILGGGPLTEQEVGSGLKEALTKGVVNGVNITSKTDGFLKNQLIKVAFPPEAQKVENTLRQLGLGKLADDVVVSLNRAAEDAAIEAKPIFVNAIKQMTFTDAMGILKGNDNAATEYLKRTTSAQLKSKFRPKIDASLNKVEATKYWGEAIGKYNGLPTTFNKINPDLGDYVTDKAMSGLFEMVAKEERNIRKNPGARTSDLLKRVFGSLD